MGNYFDPNAFWCDESDDPSDNAVVKFVKGSVQKWKLGHNLI